MSSSPGIDQHKKDPTQCMVIGCDRKGLYRKDTQSDRGFCKVHIQFATSGYRAEKRQSMINALVERVEESEDDPGYGHGV